jgi:hypothetical protein
MGIEVLEEMKEIGSNLILEFFERFFVSIYIQKNHLIINYLIVAHYYYKVCVVTFEKCVIHGIVLVIFESHIDPMYPFSNTHHRRPLQKLKFNLHIITVKRILI